MAIDGDTLVAGPVQVGQRFQADIVWMDAMPGGEKFIAIVPERAGPGSITLVQNWRAALTPKP